MKLLVDYRPEDCHKCQFSVTEFSSFFSPDILFASWWPFLLTSVSEQQQCLASQNSLLHISCGWWLSAKIILLSCHSPLLTFWGFFPIQPHIKKTIPNTVNIDPLYEDRLLADHRAGASPNLPGCHPQCCPESFLTCALIMCLITRLYKET